jgi:xanthine dehydrogenase YagR molybdenum-binding subunit
MTQVAAETLGLPIDRVKFTLGDTRLPKAPVHGGSLTMASVGSAVQAACRKAREYALARSGANDLTEALRRLGQPVEASADVKPGNEGQRLSMHSFGTVFVEVAVDPDLGETRVRRIVGAYGAGRTSCPSVSAVLRRTAKSLAAKAAMEAQGDLEHRYRSEDCLAREPAEFATAVCRE